MTRWRRYGDAIVRYQWLVGVLAIALLLDVLFFTGYYGFDDKDYTWAAHQIAHGENFLLPRASNYELAAVRLAFNFPLGLVYWLSDGSVAWMCVFQMLYHLGCVVVAYALARSLANERAGRIAAMIAATCPLLYNFAGVMMPDVALAMWTGLSLLLLVRAIRRAQHPDESGWGSSRLFVAAGLALGVAYSVKATAILLCFPSAIAIIVAFPSLRRPMWLVHGGWLALGVAVVLFAELLTFRALTGEWLSQLTVAHDSTGWDFPEWMAKQGRNPLARVLYAVGELREHMPITFLALAAGVVAHTISRKRNSAIVTFAWFNFIYLAVGTVSLTRYMPQPLFPRYFTPIIIPAIVALACAITHGLEWYAAWDRRPQRITPRVVATALIVFFASTVIYETRANLKFAGSMGNSEWARSFASAYEQANHEYPEYPIVLSMEVSFTLLPILLPDIPDHVYWHALGEPWGNDHKPMPKPPFIFLDWTRGSTRSGLARIPGIDLEHVDVDTVAIVRPDAGPGVGRLRAAVDTLVGLEPDETTTEATTWDATTIQLVRPALRASDPPPVIQVRKEGGRGAGISNDETGVALLWEKPARFDIGYFDNDDPYYTRESVTDTLDPPAKELTVTLEATSFRGGIVTGTVDVLAYDEDGTIVDRETRPLSMIGGEQQIAATLTAPDLHAYRVSYTISSPTAGGLHLDPLEVTTVPTDSTARIAGSAKPVAVVALAEGDITIRNQGAVTAVRWGPMPRFAIQYFDGRNYRRMPASKNAKLRAEAPITMFVVSGAIRQIEGAPTTADVEVFAYGEDQKVSGRSAKRLTLSTNSTPFSITVPSSPHAAAAYRIRVWFEGPGAAAVELAPIVVTPIR